MEALGLLRSLSRVQKNTFIACFLGWTLDALDFFLLTFVFVPIAHDFDKTIPQVTFAITLTLMMRPVGAFIFGWLGDRFGRRIPLMIDIVFYSIVELGTAFAPNFGTFLLLRALFGIGMGGEWGLGASLAMESLPTRTRGLFSGILQQGYAFGYLLAAVVYWIVFPLFGWRGLFVAGALPALVIILCGIFGMLLIPLWIFAPNTALLVMGGFLIQFMVQGAWGVVPVHLNELSPADFRGTFPGLAYQLGNFVAAYAAQQQAWLAGEFRMANGEPNYALTMALVQSGVFVAII